MSGASRVLPFPRPQAAPISAPRRGRAQARATTRRIIAVGGGKGGIGKSLLSANLSIELARRGLSVVALDFDLGGANLHTCLGVDQPNVTLSDFVLRRVGTLNEVMVPTGVSGLSLVSGALDALDIANPLYQQKLRLLRAVQSLDVDVAVIDLGAGTGFNVLDFFLLADHGLLTIVPEPTSVENAYRFLKAAFFRRLKAVETVYGLTQVVDEAMRTPARRTATPVEILEAVHRRDPAAGDALSREMASFRPSLVINQLREAQDMALGEAVCSAWRRFFGLSLSYLGHVRYDEEAWRAVRARRPLLLERDDQPVASDLKAVAEALLALPSRAAEAAT